MPEYSIDCCMFCLDCWNKMNHTRLTEGDVILSVYLDECRGCGEMEKIIAGDSRLSSF